MSTHIPIQYYNHSCTAWNSSYTRLGTMIIVIKFSMLYTSAQEILTAEFKLCDIELDTVRNPALLHCTVFKWGFVKRIYG